MGIEYKKIQEIAVLSDSQGYQKQLNIVKWGDGEPKVDIRTWTPNGNPGKGISLSEKEAIELANNILQTIE